MNPTKPAMHPHCYICGSKVNLTEDHIPPKSFFPVGQRQNLFTADCCEDCHRCLSMDDEVARFWLSSAASASPAGKWIWHNEAFPSLQRKPKLLENVRKFVTRLEKRTSQGGSVEASVINFPQARMIPFVRRITKALLYTLYPDYDYFPDFFNVVYQFETAANVAKVKGLFPYLTGMSRGIGVFRVWHGIPAEKPAGGLWIFIFYEAVCFICIHGKAQLYKPKYPAGYQEWHKLPRHL
jgi:hypothetical protein